MLLRRTAQNGVLKRARAVERSAVLRLLGRASAAKPIRGRPKSVTVVINQRVLGREAPVSLVEFGGALRATEERFEERHLAILVEIALGIRDGLGEILS